MLVVKNLRKTFGSINAVRDVSFQVEQGEVLGFLGPNGAGKTTTMRMITGFLPPTSGTAAIAGHDILQDPIAAKKQLGYLPENAPVYAEMTVWNYLAFIAEIRGYSGDALRKQIRRALELCRLERVRNQTIGTLSKGYKQRVCFAQALLHDPPIMIMDEPTDGLDPNQKHLVRSMIREMAARKAIVISTHILEEVEAICSRAIIINNGAIAANGAPAQLKAKSKLHGTIEIALQSGAGEAAPKLGGLSAVERVECDGNRLRVYPRAAARLMPEIMELIKAHPQWAVTEIKTLEGRLDDVFRSLTEQKPPANNQMG